MIVDTSALLAIFFDEPEREEFLRKIKSASPLDVDGETAAELRAALSERGETISHEELKSHLGLG